jgi:hypothetical protein
MITCGYKNICDNMIILVNRISFCCQLLVVTGLQAVTNTAGEITEPPVCFCDMITEWERITCGNRITFGIKVTCYNRIFCSNRMTCNILITCSCRSLAVT